jgi:hypothetical protein
MALFSLNCHPELPQSYPASPQLPSPQPLPLPLLQPSPLPSPLPLPVSIVHCQHRRCRCCCHCRHHQCPPLILPSLVGCCIVFCHLLLSSHAVMQPSTLLLPAVAANCHPPPPPPLLPLPLPLPPFVFGRWCGVYHPI